MTEQPVIHKIIEKYLDGDGRFEYIQLQRMLQELWSYGVETRDIAEVLQEYRQSFINNSPITQGIKTSLEEERIANDEN